MGASGCLSVFVDRKATSPGHTTSHPMGARISPAPATLNWISRRKQMDICTTSNITEPMAAHLFYQVQFLGLLSMLASICLHTRDFAPICRGFCNPHEWGSSLFPGMGPTLSPILLPYLDCCTVFCKTSLQQWTPSFPTVLAA